MHPSRFAVTVYIVYLRVIVPESICCCNAADFMAVCLVCSHILLQQQHMLCMCNFFTAAQCCSLTQMIRNMTLPMFCRCTSWEYCRATAIQLAHLAASSTEPYIYADAIWQILAINKSADPARQQSAANDKGTTPQCYQWQLLICSSMCELHMASCGCLICSCMDLSWVQPVFLRLPLHSLVQLQMFSPCQNSVGYMPRSGSFLILSTLNL